MTIPVEEKPTARVQYLAEVNGVATATITVNGNASAGSKHIILPTAVAATALVEQVPLNFPPGTTRLRVDVLAGQASERWHALIAIVPGDAITASELLAGMAEDVHIFFQDTSDTVDVSGFDSDAAITVFVLARAANGITTLGTAHIGLIRITAENL